ncbi:glycosyltransferase [Saccharibacter floricola]|uniref:Glycosyltransferase n=1 Tax=Saccharibacter floricola DSM 15669 TaxID=1123227 RepID=A0ABQ0NZ09_9PROT|nr:glycosyltransferase [Saccharibacter floricola]GBQ06655.1 glycosyltransferase [Saccharibacter floricola DSM 15669]
MAEAFPPYVSYGLKISPEDEQRWHKEREREVREALERGLAYYEEGELKDSFYWLGRAERLSGDCSNVMLSYAMVALELNYCRICQPRFQLLRERYQLREAAFAEIWCLCRQERLQEAARCLGNALSRSFAVKGISDVAGHLAIQTGRPGWATLSNSGIISIHCAERVQLYLDSYDLGEMDPGPVLLSQWNDRGPKRLWSDYERLSVTVKGRHVLGSPFDIRTLTRCDGVVTVKDGQLEGWLWHPEEPDFEPKIWINDAFSLTPSEERDTVSDDRPLLRPWGFSFPLSSLPDVDKKTVVVRDTHQRLLRGAPLDPQIEQVLAGKTPIPTQFLPMMVGEGSATDDERARLKAARCAVIIPVYRDYEGTRDCLRSVLQTVPQDTVVVVINDASPDDGVVQYVQQLAEQKQIILRTNTCNRGYPYSVNVGLNLCHGRDVILLNSDTTVFPGWVERLRAWLALPHVGTATPFSNDGGLTSYPSVEQENIYPSRRKARFLDQLCQRIDQPDIIELPTGNGFCMAISAACLQATGLMRDQLFAQGYAEENDFCLRARAQGFRHVAAVTVYVRHRGHASFLEGYRGLLERNLALLNTLYPHYAQDVHDFKKRDPLYKVRRFLDECCLKERAGEAGSVLMIQHCLGGGVARVVRERGQSFLRKKVLALSMVPAEKGCVLEVCGSIESFPNLSYALPSERDQLCRLLRDVQLRHIEWHHLAGHAPWIRILHRVLEVPYDVFIHDHVWFCPRIALLTGDGHYCGEPSAEACQSCIDRWGQSLEPGLTIPALLERSSVELTAARRVVAPSSDAARRLKRHIMDVKTIDIEPLEDDRCLLQGERKPFYRHAKRRIGVLGGISRWKGYDVLVDLGRHIQKHDLPLELVLFGSTVDDEKLMEAGVRVTGPYREKDILLLLTVEKIDIGFIPSVAPETWCYVLGWLWKAGLDVLSFDIGASGDRIQASGRGHVIPLGVPIDFLAQYMLNYKKIR